MKTKRILAIVSSLFLISTLFTGCGSAMEKSTTLMENGKSADMYYTNEAPMENTTENFNTEEYDVIKETGFKSAKLEPLSTFSADVDTASYSNIRRMLNAGNPVNPDAVRIEEMLNYFNYDYPEPTNNDPFSVTTEFSDCPWNENTKLLSIGLQAKNIDELPPSNIVFLIDVSGSMNYADKLPLVQKSFLMLSENLNPNDRISIVTYASNDAVILDGAKGSEQMTINDAINNLSAGGSTAGSKGIETAYQIAEKYFIENGNNRVILATDGDLNVGVTSEGDLKRLIEKKRESGISLSVLGFGTGNIKNNKMEALADNGNGNYNYIDSVLEAKKVLVNEMGGTLFTVAKDVKLQLEFNPATVKCYRLIGYENRIMNTEDFNDDTKDAGEIGAGHSVTALYEVALTGSQQEIPEIDLQYQSNPDTTTFSNSDDIATLSIRYKQPNSDESQLMSHTISQSDFSETPSENFIFASNIVEFGMLLRNSEYKGSSNYQSIIDNLSSIPNIQNMPYKNELITLVQKAQNLD